MREAIIVAGGLGTRLRPLTVNHPKHLLPVAGVPFLAHQISKLARSGVDRVWLATSYHAEEFEPVFGDGGAWGIHLEYVTETDLLGTAGALRNVADLLHSGPDDPVVVLNGDILSGHDIAAQVEQHTEERADATLHLVQVTDPRAFGCVPTDEHGRVTAFLEKSPDPVSHQVNAGCYVFRRRLLDAIPTGRPVSVERETFPGLLAGGALIVGYLESAYWLDVGTPEALVRCSSDLVRGIATSPAYPTPAGERCLLPGSRVAADAAVRGGSTVGAGARVEAGAVVEGSVLFDGAWVGRGAVLRDSVVAARAVVGERTVLEGAVVGEDAQVGADCELRAGARVWCEAKLTDGAVRFSTDV
ncbi:MAG TPA: NDP-sugar synthase [Nocardioidaceae bacterium]|nr:NDP-sugar synthase [Nocardioidaceae bacterium]